jgi:galactokinase
MTLVEQTLDTYKNKFKTGSAPRLFRAPGRVNLIGEHTDYNDGFVLPAAIDQQIVVAAAPRDDRRFHLYASNFDKWDRFGIENGVHRLTGNAWGNYVRGIVWALLRLGVDPCGMDAVVNGNIEMGAGLSSSAAIEIAVGFAILQLSGAETSRKSLAMAAQKAENDFVGMRCGIMDQFISCMGHADHALLIDCRELSCQHLPLSTEAAIVIVDSGVHRGLMDMEYNARREECEEAAAYFGVPMLRDVGMETFKTAAHGLSPVVHRRARHVVTENDRTLAAAEALKKNALRTFGELMTASHTSLRRDFEVSCPELDLLVDIALGVNGVYGARLTGAGFGGCIVALVKREATGTLISAIQEHYTNDAGGKAVAYICKASEGVSEISAGPTGPGYLPTPS